MIEFSMDLDEMIDKNTTQESKKSFAEMSNRDFLQWRVDRMNKLVSGGKYEIVEANDGVYVIYKENMK